MKENLYLRLKAYQKAKSIIIKFVHIKSHIDIYSKGSPLGESKPQHTITIYNKASF